ncbi:glycosyltransferase family 4 protein [Chloroflexi bacterium TSY]|nr:glycosyltransferase family 4 protein [Chloroflexi bacterium TSY]
MSRKIAYIMSRFPHLPETFILREMNELEQQGWTVALYPLIRQRQAVVHPEAEIWLDRMHHRSFLSYDVLCANLRILLHNPFRLLWLWIYVIVQHLRSPKFLSRALVLLPHSAYVAEQMRIEQVDQIHVHYATHPALAAWIIHRLTDIPYSLTVHAHDIFVDQTMLAPKLREASMIISISDFNREFLTKHIGPWVAEKTRIVHCGISPDDYATSVQQPIADQPLDIISIGSLQPYKGQSFLVDACAQLKAKGIPVRCRIIGEGEERRRLEDKIAKHDLESTVHLLGAKTQTEVAGLLRTAHCYVQPSIVTPAGKMEGIPVSIMEAFASGLPVVATELSGIPELVRNAETGYLVPPADATALADALTAVYRDPERAGQMAIAGQALVYSEFNLQRNVALLSDLLFNLPQKRAADHKRTPKANSEATNKGVYFGSLI